MLVEMLVLALLAVNARAAEVVVVPAATKHPVQAVQAVTVIAGFWSIKMGKRYVIVDAAGYRQNVIIWDGVTPWELPDGCTVELESECTAEARPEPISDPDAAA